MRNLDATRAAAERATAEAEQRSRLSRRSMLRGAATQVDRAQQTALERYSHAVRQHAIEAERVQVDAIVHDSVLTTLLSAARAYTPEAKELAATMAGNAIGHLREAVAVAPDSDAMVPAVVLMGASVALVAQIVSLLPGSSGVLPLNAVTSLMGAPVVVAVLLRSRHGALAG